MRPSVTASTKGPSNWVIVIKFTRAIILRSNKAYIMYYTQASNDIQDSREKTYITGIYDYNWVDL